MLSDMPDIGSFDGVRIRYERTGTTDPKRPPVVCVHGFASSAHINWLRPRIVDRLAEDGRDVVVLDLRGHGGSDKPHDTASYEGEALVRDVVAVLDEVGADRYDLVGYSMGAMTSLRLALGDARVRSVVAGGMGSRVFEDRGPEDSVADALEEPDRAAITRPELRRYRDFVELTGGDRFALAALRRAGGMPSLTREEAGSISVPVLVVVGDADDAVGSPSELADVLPGGRLEVVGGTHLNAINNPAFANAIAAFLRSVDDGTA